MGGNFWMVIDSQEMVDADPPLLEARTQSVYDSLRGSISGDFLTAVYTEFLTPSSIIDYLAFYNGKRAHSKLSYQSSLEFEREFYKNAV